MEIESGAEQRHICINFKKKDILFLNVLVKDIMIFHVYIS